MRAFHREPMTRSQLQTYSPEVRWLLGEPRPAPDYTWPRPETVARLARFSRDAK